MLKSTAIVIPARMKSVRFPAKPLALIAGKPMIEHVYNGCKQAKLASKVIIATDAVEILNEAKRFIKDPADVVMTPETLSTGTERVAWVAKDLDCDYVLNVQGDEPLVEGTIIDDLIKETHRCDDTNPVASLATKSNNSEDYFDSNVVKVVLSKNGTALYFSRSGIPGFKQGAKPSPFLKHLGLYGFKKDFLLNVGKLPVTELEQIESLEQLRFMWHGYGIRIAVVESELASVDRPEDIIAVEKILKKKGRNF